MGPFAARPKALPPTLAATFSAGCPPGFVQSLSGARAVESLTRLQRQADNFTVVDDRENTMATGTVKWFNDAKGFGFIEPDGGGADVFAHFSAVQMEGFRTLKQGSQVSYELVQGPKGDLAQNIRMAGSDAAPVEPAATEASH